MRRVAQFNRKAASGKGATRGWSIFPSNWSNLRAMSLAAKTRRATKPLPRDIICRGQWAAAAESAIVRLATGFTRMFCVIQCSAAAVLRATHPTSPAMHPRFPILSCGVRRKCCPRLGLLNGVRARGESNDSQQPKRAFAFCRRPRGCDSQQLPRRRWNPFGAVFLGNRCRVSFSTNNKTDQRATTEKSRAERRFGPQSG
jgi:hypothetical protein